MVLLHALNGPFPILLYFALPIRKGCTGHCSTTAASLPGYPEFLFDGFGINEVVYWNISKLNKTCKHMTKNCSCPEALIVRLFAHEYLSLFF